jgi:hypothetical protein
VEVQFTSVVTPNPEAVFSALQFSRALDENFLPIEPNTVFENPIDHLYAQFTYDLMTTQAQWTALWFREGELVHFETKPWDGGTGGIGYTDWEASPENWLPGEYSVHIFVGLAWKVSGQFTVEGDLPTPEISLTPSPTAGPSATVRPSDTRQPARTATIRIPSLTPSKTLTNAPTTTRVHSDSHVNQGAHTHQHAAHCSSHHAYPDALGMKYRLMKPFGSFGADHTADHSTASAAARRALLRSKARLVLRLEPAVNSLRRWSRKGVTACPRIPFSWSSL